MNDKQIDKQVKEHYQNQQLDNTRLDSLLALAEGKHTPASPIWTPRRISAIAASFIVVVVITLVSSKPVFQKQNLALLVSEEIALNHNKQLDIEFDAPDYDALRAAMKKLDFTPVRSSHLDNSQLDFLGARYCSIQGQLAAQIRLKDKNGNIQTLYQTQLNEKLIKLPEKEYMVDGVKIKQWQENGLFFGLASPAN